MFKNKVVWIIIAIVAILFFWVKGVYPESGKYGKRIRRA